MTLGIPIGGIINGSELAPDVGVSVAGAVDVAKEATAVILLRHELNVLAEGAGEGRRTFANFMKYVMMGTSSNFGNMFSMAGAVVVLPFLSMLPVQILLNNLLYDTSRIAIPLDSVDEVMIVEPRRWDINFVRDFMLVLGGFLHVHSTCGKRPQLTCVGPSHPGLVFPG
jgi:P-type Mg2+ transporter